MKAGVVSPLFFAHSLQLSDTVPAKRTGDTLQKDTVVRRQADSSRLKKDSLVVVADTVPLSKDSLDAPVHYHADDSALLMVPTRNFVLYGKARTEYKDMKLDAGVITYDDSTKVITAYGAKDTTGDLASKPTFVQGDLKSISDTIIYRMNDARALTKNTFFQEGEIFVNARALKKVDSNSIFARDARFTTCNLDTPHFAFRTRRMKIVNDKIGVTGRVYPEVESVPIPMISLPFSLFPLNRERHGGVLFPTFTASESFGLGLEGLGYYLTPNQYSDITITSNIYSYGGWRLNTASRYVKRYKYTGSLNISLQKTRTLNTGFIAKDEFSQSNTFMINWSHSRDSKARPGTSFSANVNFGSTRFNRNQFTNPYQNFQNQLSSSVSYNKDWNGKYNLSLNLNHNQNSVSRLMNLNLPTANFNVVTMYPFQKKEQVGAQKWYEKIGIGYSGNFQNLVSFYDSAFSFKKMLDTLQWGAIHSVPITLALPALGPFIVTPSVSYGERWYGQRIFRSWNNTLKKVDTTIQKGFYTAREMSFGAALNTRIFGTYLFKRSKHVEAIRHEIRPSVSFSYRPDFGAKYFYNTRIDTAGNVMRFSQFDGGIIGPISEGAFGGITFAVDNLLEMKVHNRDTTSKEKSRKVKLLDGFGFSGSYNFLIDSFALSSINLYARSTLFEKVSITASAVLDPYQVNARGYRVNKLALDPSKLNFGRLINTSLAVSTSFSSKTRDGKEAEDKNIPVDPFMTPDEQQRQLQFVRANPAEFTDFNIPWTVSLSYSLSLNRQMKPDYSGFESIVYSTMNFNGDFSLSPKWKLGGQGFYDFSTAKLQQFSMFISREMHCWQLSINVMPIGIYRSFNIMFSPKSGILRDLKINRSRTFTNY
ncbi:putative LPS assembly protein LptD [Sediminibacterium soli]|uniref:putative LPS assembly protein LptD n=1 Tax=Sediminibacterium soli TaxID=2698829 RepID=UPI00137A4344|nr:putative LPS assembly protein LptD [Sediminibacterium soli]NCI46455.1 LPS-assembly protein LptD [Sediminibacterium soli]